MFDKLILNPFILHIKRTMALLHDTNTIWTFSQNYYRNSFAYKHNTIQFWTFFYKLQTRHLDTQNSFSIMTLFGNCTTNTYKTRDVNLWAVLLELKTLGYNAESPSVERDCYM